MLLYPLCSPPPLQNCFIGKCHQILSALNLGFHTDDAGLDRFLTLSIGRHVKFDACVKNSAAALPV